MKSDFLMLSQCPLDATYQIALTEIAFVGKNTVAPYAHTHLEHPNDSTKWEPLYAPFGDGDEKCQRNTCQKCAGLVIYHALP